MLKQDPLLAQGNDESILLVVDDSAVQRHCICKLFEESSANLTLLQAANAAEARAITETTDIDFATIDYNMPGEDGLTLSQELRERFPNAKIAILTANKQEGLLRRAQESSISLAYKPCSSKWVTQFLDRE